MWRSAEASRDAYIPQHGALPQWPRARSRGASPLSRGCIQTPLSCFKAGLRAVGALSALRVCRLSFHGALIWWHWAAAKVLMTNWDENNVSASGEHSGEASPPSLCSSTQKLRQEWNAVKCKLLGAWRRPTEIQKCLESGSWFKGWFLYNLMQMFWESSNLFIY